MKPKLKPPGTKRLKLQHDILLSTSVFRTNLRQYDKARRQKFYMNFVSQPLFAPGANRRWLERGNAAPLEAKSASLGTFPLVKDVGHYFFGSSRSSIFMAGPCRLTVSNAVLKATTASL